MSMFVVSETQQINLKSQINVFEIEKAERCFDAELNFRF